MQSYADKNIEARYFEVQDNYKLILDNVVQKIQVEDDYGFLEERKNQEDK